MENEKLKRYIELVISQKLDSMSNMSIPFHTHNGADNPQLDPAIALLGFPTNQVTSATASPTDIPLTGTIRFQVDTTPKYALWAYLSYNNAGVITSAWKGIQLPL